MIALALAAALAVPAERADISPPPGAAAPMDLMLEGSDGRPVRLGEALAGRPALLTLGYAACPSLCSVVLDGVARALRPLSAAAGRDFSLVSVSIDPAETSEDAARLRELYLRRYGRDGAEWRFLTGEPAQVARLAAALGFRYAPDSAGGYAHAAGLFVLRPDGSLARVLYGVEFAPRDVKLALAEAGSRGGSPFSSRTELAERVMLYCYDYDPARGRYGLAITRLLRAGGIVTACLLAAGVGFLLRRERRAP